ncbi:hypothetical protein IJG76_00795 [Candidatus Saccharibacteria bacterium]|nr:hypothetical protein [Candidatus Saccharibacteria bacterium]
MNVFMLVSVVLMAGLINASFQVAPGILLLLYHSSLGCNITGKTRALASSYISGVAYMLLLTLAAVILLVLGANLGVLIHSLVPAVSVSSGNFFVSAILLLLTGVVALILYYRPSRSTELWLARPVARFLARRAELTNSNTEAFSLGLMSVVGELPFSFALMATVASFSATLPLGYICLSLALFTIASILPLVLLRAFIRRGKSVIDIQRWRVKEKTFLKYFSGIALISLGLFVLAFFVLGV